MFFTDIRCQKNVIADKKYTLPRRFLHSFIPRDPLLTFFDLKKPDRNFPSVPSPESRVPKQCGCFRIASVTHNYYFNRITHCLAFQMGQTLAQRSGALVGGDDDRERRNHIPYCRDVRCARL